MLDRGTIPHKANQYMFHLYMVWRVRKASCQCPLTCLTPSAISVFNTLRLMAGRMLLYLSMYTQETYQATVLNFLPGLRTRAWNPHSTAKEAFYITL